MRRIRVTQQIVGTQVQEMFGSIAPRYDITNSVLSFGIHHHWKRLTVNSLGLPHESLVVDLCTGTGDLLPLLRSKFRRVAGADFCLPMLQVGKMRPGHGGIPILQGDALRLPFASDSVDGITIAFGIRNLESLPGGLAEMR